MLLPLPRWVLLKPSIISTSEASSFLMELLLSSTFCRIFSSYCRLSSARFSCCLRCSSSSNRLRMLASSSLRSCVEEIILLALFPGGGS